MDELFNTLFERLVLAGGPMMWVLVPCSLITLGAILQTLVRLRRARVTPRDIETLAAECAAPEKRTPFLVSLRTHTSPLGRALWHTLKTFNIEAGRPEARQLNVELEEACATIGDELAEYLGLLGTLYTVAPLLGIMGTVMGMMKTFYEFAIQQQRSLTLLSVGIQEALITTVWGLAIAIVAFVATYWLQGRIRRIERGALPEALERAIDALFAAPDKKDQAETE